MRQSPWGAADKTQLVGITLPDGVEVYSTPSHGFLRVDLRKHTAKLSTYDYRDGPHHVLLEEDCSATLWLAEHGLIPQEPWLEKMAAGYERVPA